MMRFPFVSEALATLCLALLAAAAEEPAKNEPPKEKPAQAAPQEGAEKPKTDAKEPPQTDAERTAALIEQLGSEEAPVRAKAAEALGKAKTQAAIPKLIAMLDDPDEDAQWKATCALGAMGAPALPQLIANLSHEKERVRWKAENAVRMIGADSVPALMEALKDKRVRVRQSAAYLLGELADPRCLADLGAALGDKDEDTRWKAATSLTKFANRTTPVALKLLQSPSIEARRCAAWVFQQTADAGAVPDLVRALKDRDEQVRWNAAIALQKVGPPCAEPLFAILRSSAKEGEKHVAEWILEGIKDVKVQTALRDLKGAISRGGQETAERPRPKTLPKSVVLAITSEPDKATLFVDDKYAGVTPITIESLTPGHHFIKLTKRDHLPWTKLVELLYPEEKINAKLAVKPKGVLVVTSEPSEADVYIDGEYEGKTPFEKKDLDANPYTVRVEKEHFQPWETEVEVRAGQEVKAHGQLKSKVEGWYLARLKENPNDVSCHTELAHYYMVRGELDKSARSIGAALQVMANGADTSGYAGRLVQEIDKMWGQAFQFGGNLEVSAVRKALHVAIHEVWKRNQDKPALRALLDQLHKSTGADFTRPPQ